MESIERGLALAEVHDQLEDERRRLFQVQRDSRREFDVYRDSQRRKGRERGVQALCNLARRDHFS